MPQLTDTQLVILSAAAQHEDGHAWPVPKSLKTRGAALTKTLEALAKKDLLEERPATPDTEAWREADDGRRLMLVISKAGLAALDGAPAARPSKRPNKRRPSASMEETPSGKAGTILTLLNRPKGARINELQKATGWQAHSIRAALTGLRKRGITITRSQDVGGTVYRAEAN